MVLELARLPPEVRQLVWEATLPGQRLFHVSDFAAETTNQLKSDRKDDGCREQTLNCHIRHPPPVAHQVCRESRAVMLLRGFFLGRAWFNPHRDMLYLDRNMRHRLATRASGLERVLHVGLEWRAWFRDVPRPSNGDQEETRRWQAALEPLLLRHCPRAETVSFVLPRVRHVGGIPSGREPYGAERQVCHLEELPDGVQVPWERAPVAVAGGVLMLGDPETALAQIGGGSANVEWGVIRRQMEAAVGALQDERSERGVRVRGWWLVRPQAPTGEEDGEAREFWS